MRAFFCVLACFLTLACERDRENGFSADASADGAVLDGSVDGTTPSVDGNPDVEQTPAGSEDTCQSVCANMGDLLFPFSFCEDLGAFKAGAAFCQQQGSQNGTSCPAFCSQAIAAAAPGRCRAAYPPVMRCIVESGSYEEFVLRGASPACQSALLELASACWVDDWLQRERGQWTVHRPLAYEFRFSQSDDDARDAVVVVRGTQVVSVTGGAALSIDQIFDELAKCTSRPGESAALAFDANLHYPTEGACQRADVQKVWPSGLGRAFAASGLTPLP